MISKTELANQALAHVSQTPIADIDEVGNKSARVCKQFIDSSIHEVLRTARWNCATKRATLTQSATPPNHGYRHAYQLPADFLRLMEVNGEQYDDAQMFLEIEGDKLVSNFDQAKIRYIAKIDVSQMDPLLAKAVAIHLAGQITVPLSCDLNLKSQLVQLLQMAMNDARSADAIETGNRLNREFVDSETGKPSLTERYSPRGIPFLLLIGKNAKIAAVNPAEGQLEKAIQAALAK